MRLVEFGCMLLGHEDNPKFEDDVRVCRHCLGAAPDVLQPIIPKLPELNQNVIEVTRALHEMNKTLGARPSEAGAKLAWLVRKIDS